MSHAQHRLEASLEASETRYQRLLEQAAVGVLIAAPTGQFVEANSAICAVLGYTRNELLQLRVPDVLELTATRDRIAELAERQTVLSERRLRRKDGTWVVVEVSTELSPEGAFQAIVRDMTARDEAEVALRQSEERLRLALEGAQMGVWDWDVVHDSVFWSSRTGGDAQSDVLGPGQSASTVLALFHPEDAGAVQRAILEALAPGGTHFEVEARTIGEGGTTRWLSFWGKVFRNTAGEPVRLAGTTLDITARKTAELALVHQTLHDGLTQLPNRILLHQRLQAAAQKAKQVEQPVALLLLDLDRFKEVNDTLGHPVGDAVLVEVAKRLSQMSERVDTVARLGGDEFALIVPDTDRETAAVLAQALLQHLQEPFAFDGFVVPTDASIGVVVSPDDGDDADTLLQRADVAMYAAKASGAGWMFYAAEHDLHSVERLSLLSDIRLGLERGEFCLYYQPKIDSRSGRVAGLEALIRWQHPKHGFVPPDRFIPLAEQSGLMRPITRWVFDAALADYCRLRDLGRAIPMAINISARNLDEGDLVDFVERTLARFGVAPHQLEIELTESSLMHNQKRSGELLKQLSEMGIRIAIDDFGTGYSSLALLRHLPVHQLKIDRSFVREMDTNNGGRTIVRSIIDLAHNLGLEVVAEGVEDSFVLGTLAALGCDQAQGYLIAKPMPFGQITTWVKEWSVADVTGQKAAAQ
ncbi:MAG TPA: EAL domain-containing protein [Chloroflexota bacterium]|jgi:diguanylate cyclase (GGDEF)-like protein/PAS domain S-box-containing protein|nr:EAL domain-containing protein [Chloroflexota bacterium]